MRIMESIAIAKRDQRGSGRLELSSRRERPLEGHQIRIV